MLTKRCLLLLVAFLPCLLLCAAQDEKELLQKLSEQLAQATQERDRVSANCAAETQRLRSSVKAREDQKADLLTTVSQLTESRTKAETAAASLGNQAKEVDLLIESTRAELADTQEKIAKALEAKETFTEELQVKRDAVAAEKEETDKCRRVLETTGTRARQTQGESDEDIQKRIDELTKELASTTEAREQLEEQIARKEKEKENLVSVRDQAQQKADEQHKIVDDLTKKREKILADRGVDAKDFDSDEILQLKKKLAQAKHMLQSVRQATSREKQTNNAVAKRLSELGERMESISKQAMALSRRTNRKPPTRNGQS